MKEYKFTCTENDGIYCVCPIHNRDRLIEKLAEKVRLYHEKYGTEYLGGTPYQILQKEAAEIGIKI